MQEEKSRTRERAERRDWKRQCLRCERKRPKEAEWTQWEAEPQKGPGKTRTRGGGGERKPGQDSPEDKPQKQKEEGT